MESTKHPDQNPDKVQALNQEENSQQENAVNTVEELSLPVENAVADIDPDSIQEKVPTEVSEAESIDESEAGAVEEPVLSGEVSEPVALSEPELMAQVEVPSEAEASS